MLRPDSAPDGPLRSAAYLGDGQRVLTTSTFGLTVWDRKSGKALVHWHGPFALNIASTAVSPDGQLAVVTFSGYSLRRYTDGRSMLFTDRAARLIDTATGTETVLQGHTHRVVSAQFSADGKRIITASWDGTARIWDTGTRKTLHVLRGHSCGLASAGFSADGNKAFTVSSGHVFKPFPDAILATGKAGVDVPVPTGARVREGSGGEFGDAGVRSVSDFARIWDAESGEGLAVLHMPNEGGGTQWALRNPSRPRAALSHDGARLAAVQGNSYCLWETASGKVVRLKVPYLRTQNEGAHLPPVFSADGRTVLTSMGARPIRCGLAGQHGQAHCDDAGDDRAHYGGALLAWQRPRVGRVARQNLSGLAA